MPAKTEVFKAGSDGMLSPDEIARLAAAAKGCKIIAFPTDTVYGLGSTGLIKAASRRIYQIKQRPSTKPLPILVHSLDAAKKWVKMTPTGEALAKKFWPGALTLVLKHTLDGALLTFPEYQTLAIRVPKHPLLLKIIEASGVPWATTSANISDSPSLTDGESVAKQFDGLVDFVVDAGPSGGVESTIVDATGESPRITREGSIPADKIREAA
jgi:L-threonylcarbamoyladenylate synthase